jgi:hypothetical protein
VHNDRRWRDDENRQKGTVMLGHGKMLFLFTVSAALAAASPILGRSASADPLQCLAERGSLRFFDFETNVCGHILGSNDNPDWSVFGWSDRADQFGNDGLENLCLYDGTHCRGTHVLLPIGFTVDWRNTVSSSAWVAGNSCPASC